MLDKIEFFMYCDGIHPNSCMTNKCKYEWYCTFFKFAYRFTTMIYSEGE